MHWLLYYTKRVTTTLPLPLALALPLALPLLLALALALALSPILLGLAIASAPAGFVTPRLTHLSRLTRLARSRARPAATGDRRAGAGAGAGAGARPAVLRKRPSER